MCLIWNLLMDIWLNLRVNSPTLGEKVRNIYNLFKYLTLPWYTHQQISRELFHSSRQDELSNRSADSTMPLCCTCLFYPLSGSQLCCHCSSVLHLSRKTVKTVLGRLFSVVLLTAWHKQKSCWIFYCITLLFCTVIHLGHEKSLAL